MLGPDLMPPEPATPDGVPVRGSIILSFLWTALFFYPILALLLAYSYFILDWSAMDFSILVVGVVALATYFAWSAQGAMAYSVTLSEDGVEVHHRPILVPFRRPRRITKVKWRELREPAVKMGGVTIRTDSAWSWLNLNYGQARAVLSDPRCPLYGRVPKPIARRVGILSP